MLAAQFFRVALLQNQIAPEHVLNQYENGTEKAKKDPKNDSKRLRKNQSPLLMLKNISPAVSKKCFRAQNLGVFSMGVLLPPVGPA